MTTQQRSTVVGVFNDPSQAQDAVRALRQAGFREDQIGVLAQDGGDRADRDVTESADRDVTATTDVGRTHAGTGAAVGVATGAGVGALWALGIAAGALPAIGPVIAGGVLASILASAAGGAAVGGLVGTLVGLGITEEEARYYEGEFTSGRTIVTVSADGRADEAWNLLHQHGAYNQQTPARTALHAAPTTSATAGTDATAARAGTGEGQTIELREEQLHASKQPVQTGEVRVHKEVITEQQNIQVPVTREEVVVERRPASGQVSSSDIRAGEEIRIPVTEERPQVHKETVVKEEVHVGKQPVTETETVTATVRKEEAHVEKKGDVDVRGDTGKTHR